MCTTGAGMADLVRPAEQGTRGRKGVSAHTAMCTTARGERRSLSKGMPTQLAATLIPGAPFLNPTHRVESSRGRSAVTTTGESRRATRHGEVRAWAAHMAVGGTPVADTTDCEAGLILMN